jgi:hypothetical protein
MQTHNHLTLLKQSLESLKALYHPQPTTKAYENADQTITELRRVIALLEKVQEPEQFG